MASEHDVVAVERDQLTQESLCPLQHAYAGTRFHGRVRRRIAFGAFDGAGEDAAVPVASRVHSDDRTFNRAATSARAFMRTPSKSG